MKHLFLAALVATGCLSTVTTSSRDYLSPKQSHAYAKATPEEIARALLALFTHRGFVLVDQHAIPSGGIEMKLKGTRTQLTVLTDGGWRSTASAAIGSVFHVTIEPWGTGITTIDLHGKPTLDGHEACESDRPEKSCEPLLADYRQLQEMSGSEEAETIHGVISELELEGLVLPPPPEAVQRAAEERAACLDQRRTIFKRASGIAEPYARLKLLETAPTCPE